MLVLWDPSSRMRNLQSEPLPRCFSPTQCQKLVPLSGSPLSGLLSWPCPTLERLTEEETETQRGSDTCWGSHSRAVAELGFKDAFPTPPSREG